ncbi:MAG: hypothetical protein PHY92_07390 [Alphaproteobacteria bacterium]|nr:hypothetical protein [Alphaproteobacteria bacterium]
MRTAGTIDLNEIHSFTDFLRNAKDHTRRLKKTGKPSVLTVNGQAELVVQDAKSYQLLLKQLDELEDFHAVQRGIADMKAGRGRVMDEVFDELDAKYFGKPAKRGRAK